MVEPEKVYFHFFSEGGLPASLPFTKTILTFPVIIRGVPGVVYDAETKTSQIPAYQCGSCREHFIVSDTKDLRHGCTKDGGVFSTQA